MKDNVKKVIFACLILGIGAIVMFFLFPKSKVFTVSFNTDGGSAIPSQEVKKGGKVVKPVDPIKENFSFVRWEYHDEEYDFNSPVEEDIILNAIWNLEDAVKKYKITFILDDITKEIEVSDASEIDIEQLGFEEKEGYNLKWYVNGKEYDLSTPLTDDLTIEGKYVKAVSYIVKFNSNGGSSVPSQTVKVGGKATSPKNVIREGYIFDGWYLNDKKYDFNQVVTKSITLVAKWQEDPNVKRYTVTFDSNGGSKIPSQTVIENKTAKEPSNPTKSGYNFDGWYLNNKKYDFKSKVTKDITLVAKWKEIAKYKIVFDSKGGSSVPSQIVIEGNKVAKPNNPTRDGYVFSYWALNGVEYDFNKIVKGNMTLVAVWLKKFTVTFDSNGGSKIASQIVIQGDKAKRPTDPAKPNYLFVSWKLNGKNYDFDSAVNDDITLIASWEKIPENEFVVIFDSNGGSSIPSQRVKAGEKVTKPTDPTRTNYKFKGWKLNGKDYDFKTPVTSDITLKASWESTAVLTYMVNFDSNGGSSIPSQTVKAGEKLTRPTDPTRTNYSFKGWKLDGNTYDFNSPVNSNFTLVASWEALPVGNYTVVFNSNGGTLVETQTVRGGEKATRPADPTRDDFIFKGWKLNGQYYDFNSPVNSNIILVASWEAAPIVTHTVTFDTNGGSIVPAQTVREGEKVVRPANPTKNHYNLSGWKLNGNTYDFNSPVTEDITLTASWTLKNYTIRKIPVDNMSLDVKLTVYEEGRQIAFTNIMYNGRIVPTTLNASSIQSITTFQVTLTDGVVVNASVE